MRRARRLLAIARARMNSMKFITYPLAIFFFLLAFAFIVTAVDVHAQTSPVQGAITFNSDGTNVNFVPVDGFSATTSPYVNYGGGIGTRFNYSTGQVVTGSLCCVATFPNITNVKTFLGLDANDPSGEYAIVINTAANSYSVFNVYYKVYWNASNLTVEPRNPDSGFLDIDLDSIENYNTRFIGFTAQGLGNRVVRFNVTYYLDKDEVDCSNPLRCPSLVRMQYAQAGNTTLIGISNEIDENSFGTSTITFDHTFPAANAKYDIHFSFDSFARPFTGVVPFPKSYIYSCLTLTNSNLTQVCATENYNALPETTFYESCQSIADFGCALRNAGRFLFYPTDFPLTAYQNSLSTLYSKAPFSYFTDVKLTLETAAAQQTTAAFPQYNIAIFGTQLAVLNQASLDSVYPANTRILIRNTISHGLWIMFTVAAFFIVLNLFNKSGYYGESLQRHEEIKAAVNRGRR